MVARAKICSMPNGYLELQIELKFSYHSHFIELITKGNLCHSTQWYGHVSQKIRRYNHEASCGKGLPTVVWLLLIGNEKWGWLIFLICFKNVLQEIGSQVYSHRDVVAEIRDRATRERLQVLPYDIHFRNPSPEATKAGTHTYIY